MREAVVVEAVRTPVGKRNGGLSSVHAADLSAVVLTELVERTGIDPGTVDDGIWRRATVARTGIDTGTVDDVIWGCVTQLGDQSSNIGRFAVLAAGWPEHVPGTTIN